MASKITSWRSVWYRWITIAGRDAKMVIAMLQYKPFGFVFPFWFDHSLSTNRRFRLYREFIEGVVKLEKILVDIDLAKKREDEALEEVKGNGGKHGPPMFESYEPAEEDEPDLTKAFDKALRAFNIGGDRSKRRGVRTGYWMEQFGHLINSETFLGEGYDQAVKYRKPRQQQQKGSGRRRGKGSGQQQQQQKNQQGQGVLIIPNPQQQENEED